jgi:hypothetical protein
MAALVMPARADQGRYAAPVLVSAQCSAVVSSEPKWPLLLWIACSSWRADCR